MPRQKKSALDYARGLCAPRPQTGFSVKNGSAFSDPSRCFTSICTFPSASSSSFLHSAERPTPSSNSLRDSSRRRSPFSNCSTIDSNFFSDSSNDAMHLLRGGFLTMRQHAGDHFRSRIVTPERRRHLHPVHHRPYHLQHLLRDPDSLLPRCLGSARLRHSQ